MKVPTILIVGVLRRCPSASQAAVYGGGNQRWPDHVAGAPGNRAPQRSAEPQVPPRRVRPRRTATSTGSASGGEFAWNAAAVGGVLLVLLIGRRHSSPLGGGASPSRRPDPTAAAAG